MKDVNKLWSTTNAVFIDSLESAFQNGGHKTALTHMQYYSAIIANKTSCIY